MSLKLSILLRLKWSVRLAASRADVAQLRHEWYGTLFFDDQLSVSMDVLSREEEEDRVERCAS